MKRRLLAALLVITVMLSLVACNKKEAVWGFNNGKITLVPGEKFVPEDEGLGETVKYMEAPSCYYDGLDKIFTYNGYKVTTYPADGGDYIQDITIEGTYKSAKGIGVGDSLSSVLSAYGENAEITGKLYRYYEDESKYIYFFINDDVVKYYGYSTKTN